MYETTLTEVEVLDSMELWLLKQNLLPSFNGTPSREDITIYEKIEDLIKKDHIYWSNMSKWDLFNHAKELTMKGI